MGCTSRPSDVSGVDPPMTCTASMPGTWRKVQTICADRWSRADALASPRSAVNSTSATPSADTGTEGRNDASEGV